MIFPVYIIPVLHLLALSFLVIKSSVCDSQRCPQLNALRYKVLPFCTQDVFLNLSRYLSFLSPLILTDPSYIHLNETLRIYLCL